MITLDNNTPIVNALYKVKCDKVTKFDIPIHRSGRWDKEMLSYYAENVLFNDSNSMRPLDNLIDPISVIKESEDITAKAFEASNAFCIVNGTTAAVQAMIMYACKAGEKIILPRNIHKSVINALILSGAIPIYVNPGTDKCFGLSLGMSVDDIETTVKNNPDAKAIFINNPTCYGICSNLKRIVEIAHENDMLVLVDEAYGAHFYFSDDLPDAAMHIGADLAAVGMHKTGGSLTQSSFLLCGNKIDSQYLRGIINLTQTTSASYLLLVSLELARKNMLKNGKELLRKVIEATEFARCEINKIGGYFAYGKDLINGNGVFDFDVSKLSVFTHAIGLSGIEVLEILLDKYNIQLECGDTCNILALLSTNICDLATPEKDGDVQELLSALKDIKKLHSKPTADAYEYVYIEPNVAIAPQKAFYSSKLTTKIDLSVGEVCGELLMSYPPGIPILAPGELITREIVDYFNYSKKNGCEFVGSDGIRSSLIKVVRNDIK